MPVNLKIHFYPYFFQNFCQQTAALALGRLANYNDDLAEAVVKSDILPQLVYSLAEQNRFYKKEKGFEIIQLLIDEPIKGKTVEICKIKTLKRQPHSSSAQSPNTPLRTSSRKFQSLDLYQSQS